MRMTIKPSTLQCTAPLLAAAAERSEQRRAAPGTALAPGGAKACAPARLRYVLLSMQH